MYVKVLRVGVFAIGRYKCVFGMVEAVEKSLMEWDSGSEYGGEYDWGVDYLALCCGERCFYVNGFII